MPSTPDGSNPPKGMPLPEPPAEAAQAQESRKSVLPLSLFAIAKQALLERKKLTQAERIISKKKKLRKQVTRRSEAKKRKRSKRKHVAKKKPVPSLLQRLTATKPKSVARTSSAGSTHILYVLPQKKVVTAGSPITHPKPLPGGLFSLKEASRAPTEKKQSATQTLSTLIKAPIPARPKKSGWWSMLTRPLSGIFPPKKQETVRPPLPSSKVEGLLLPAKKPDGVAAPAQASDSGSGPSAVVPSEVVEALKSASSEQKKPSLLERLKASLFGPKQRPADRAPAGATSTIPSSMGDVVVQAEPSSAEAAATIPAEKQTNTRAKRARGSREKALEDTLEQVLSPTQNDEEESASVTAEPMPSENEEAGAAEEVTAAGDVEAVETSHDFWSFLNRKPTDVPTASVTPESVSVTPKETSVNPPSLSTKESIVTAAPAAPVTQGAGNMLPMPPPPSVSQKKAGFFSQMFSFGAAKRAAVSSVPPPASLGVVRAPTPGKPAAVTQEKTVAVSKPPAISSIGTAATSVTPKRAGVPLIDQRIDTKDEAKIAKSEVGREGGWMANVLGKDIRDRMSSAWAFLNMPIGAVSRADMKEDAFLKRVKVETKESKFGKGDGTLGSILGKRPEVPSAEAPTEDALVRRISPKSANGIATIPFSGTTLPKSALPPASAAEAAPVTDESTKKKTAAERAEEKLLLEAERQAADAKRKRREEEAKEVRDAIKTAQQQAAREVPHVNAARLHKEGGGLNEFVSALSHIGLGKERNQFTSNLATMLNAGLPLIDALNTIETEVRNKGMKKMVRRMLETIENGSPLWRAMNDENFFSPHAIALVRVGEEAGNLAENMEYLSMQETKDQELQSKVKMAMIYPAIVLVIMFVIVMGLGTFVLPKLVSVLTSLNVPLPFVTRVVIGFSNLFAEYGLIIAPGAVLAFFSLVVLARYTPLRIFTQWMIFKIPGIGALARESTIARFGVILGGLLRAGVPVVEAVHSLVNVTTIMSYRHFYERLLDHITVGDSFAKSFAVIRNSDKLIPVSVQQLVITGEKSGSLSRIMLKIADIYDKKATNTAQKLPVILEPLILIFIGSLVGTIAFAIIVPIYSIVGNVGH